MTPVPSACAFDAYGTLFDVHSAIGHVAGELAEAQAVSSLWRAKQLQYTWLRSLMGRYADFQEVTADALRYALRAHGIEGGRLHGELMAAYMSLDAYPEVGAVLSELRERGMRIAILSNGSPEMLRAAVTHAGLEELVDEVYSVDAVGVYKPHPDAYRIACEGFGMSPAEIAFVSSNAWDVTGGAAFGFRTIWVNRSGEPAEELGVAAAHEIASLRELPSLLSGSA